MHLLKVFMVIVLAHFIPRYDTLFVFLHS